MARPAAEAKHGRSKIYSQQKRQYQYGAWLATLYLHEDEEGREGCIDNFTMDPLSTISVLVLSVKNEGQYVSCLAKYSKSDSIFKLLHSKNCHQIHVT
jgi:hypothetical protein